MRQCWNGEKGGIIKATEGGGGPRGGLRNWIINLGEKFILSGRGGKKTRRK